MTLADIARANGMSVEEFFAHCYRWRTGIKFPPKSEIRRAVIQLNTEGLVPLYVSAYMNLFSVRSTLPN